MSQKSKIFKIPLRIEKKTLKAAHKRSLSKIVHKFAHVAIKMQDKGFSTTLEMNSTVGTPSQWSGFSKNRGF